MQVGTGTALFIPLQGYPKLREEREAVNQDHVTNGHFMIVSQDNKI